MVELGHRSKAVSIVHDIIGARKDLLGGPGFSVVKKICF